MFTKKPVACAIIPAQSGYYVAQYVGDENHTNDLRECFFLDPVIAWRVSYEEGEQAFYTAITIEQGETNDDDILCPDGRVHSAGGDSDVDDWLAAQRRQAIKEDSMRVVIRRTDAQDLV